MYMIIKKQTPIPFKSSGRYVIGDLLIPAKNRLTSLIKESLFKANDIKPFQDLESTIIMDKYMLKIL